MASPSRSPTPGWAKLTLASKSRRPRRRASTAVVRLLATALGILVLLALVLRLLPPRTRHAELAAGPGVVQALPSDLHLSGVQMSTVAGGQALYLDGLVTTTGTSRITGAMVEVGFHDTQGNLIASLQSPMVGMAPGGRDVVGNEFVKQPIRPKQMRFFRVAIDHVPSAWNHEVPALDIVGVKAK